MVDYYFLQVNATGLAIIVYLNGVPLVIENFGEGVQETLPVNQWLKQDKNVLQMAIRRPDGKPEKTESEDVPLKEMEKVKVVLFLHEKGADSPKAARVLGELSWPDPTTPPVYPHYSSEQVTASFPDLPRTIFWSHAAPIGNLSIKDKHEMFGAVSYLADLLKQKKLEDAFQMMRYRFEDEALVEGKSVGQLKNAVLEMWNSMLSQQGPQLQSVVFDNLNFEIVGEKNIVLVTQNDGFPAIEFEDTIEDISFGIQLFFSNINNQWIIIR